MNARSRIVHEPHRRLTHVIQGQFRVSRDEDEVLTTILGSCVATCLCDPVARVGGMNHFVLAEGTELGGMGYRYGAQAMELLINGLIKMGARKNRLQAKLFGGAQLDPALGRIGEANGRFALQFLTAEGIACVAQSLGGDRARRIRFAPTTGQARQLLIAADYCEDLRPAARAPQDAGDVTLFEE